MSETFTHEKPSFVEYVHKLKGKGMGFDVLTGSGTENAPTVTERVAWAIAKAHRGNDVGHWVFCAMHLDTVLSAEQRMEIVGQLCQVVQMHLKRLADRHADELPMLAKAALDGFLQVEVVRDDDAEKDLILGACANALYQAEADFEWRASGWFFKGENNA